MHLHGVPMLDKVPRLLTQLTTVCCGRNSCVQMVLRVFLGVSGCNKHTPVRGGGSH
jgi:hypothetical protein